MKRTPEPRSAFPREMTLEDCKWSLDERIFQQMCFETMTRAQEEYVRWDGRGIASIHDADYDVYDEIEKRGYWVALLVEDDMLKLASNWNEAGKHEREHGAECVVLVKLTDNDKEIAR